MTLMHSRSNAFGVHANGSCSFVNTSDVLVLVSEECLVVRLPLLSCMVMPEMQHSGSVELFLKNERRCSFI